MLGPIKLFFSVLYDIFGYVSGVFKTVSLFSEYPERWKRCLSKVTSAFGFATGSLYVQKNFKDSSKKEVCSRDTK